MFGQATVVDDKDFSCLSDLVSRPGMSSALLLSKHCLVVPALWSPSREQVHHLAG